MLTQSHHGYFQQNNRRFRNAAFRAKMTAEFPRLTQRAYTLKRLKYFQQLIPDYCWCRRTISLSTDEVQKCFHLSEKSAAFVLKSFKNEVKRF